MGGGHGLRTVAYYVDWATYARAHQPYDLPASHLTHVLFAFANIRGDTGEVVLGDKWADTDKRYTDHGDTWNDVGTNLYGCAKQLYLLKKHNRHLKVLLSIGGWTWSTNFAPVSSTPQGRQTFARTAVKIIEDIGFDGIDIDWEYPSGPEQSANFIELLREVRHELNKAEETRHHHGQPRPHFLLTIACSAGPQHYNQIDPRAIDPYLDFWNLMAYDYAGSWDTTSGHQANLFPSRSNPQSTPFNTDQALRYYTSHGVHPSKLVIGMPLYGRAFQQTSGPGAPYSGVGEGSWENGVWDYKKLPLEGCTEHVDREAVASWCHHPGTGLMVTYDNAEVAGMKAEFIRRNGFGGAMWWESSADREMGGNGSAGGSLIERVVGEFGGTGRLESSENCLGYPNSQYDNLREGMP